MLLCPGLERLGWFLPETAPPLSIGLFMVLQLSLSHIIGADLLYHKQKSMNGGGTKEILILNNSFRVCSHGSDLLHKIRMQKSAPTGANLSRSKIQNKSAAKFAPIGGGFFLLIFFLGKTCSRSDPCERSPILGHVQSNRSEVVPDVDVGHSVVLFMAYVLPSNDYTAGYMDPAQIQGG